MSILKNLVTNRPLFLRCCAVVLACAAGFAAVLNIWDAFLLAAVPFEMNYEEGNILNAAVRIVNGLSPYPNPHLFPNVLNPYGPVLYYLVSLMVRIDGVRLFLPRLIVIISALVAATLVALLVRRYSHSIALTIASGFLFLTSQLVYFWLPLLRVDILSIAFVLTGLLIFGTKRWLWSVPVFVLALFVKCSMLAGPAACMAYLLIQKQWKRAGLFAAFGITISAICLVMAQWMTGGWFLFHIFRTHADPFSWRLVTQNLWGMAHLDFPLALLSACYLIFKFIDRDASLPGLYLLFAGLGTVTIGKLGSDSNHLLELHAAFTLCSVLALGLLAERLHVHWMCLATTAIATVLLVMFCEKRPMVIDERAMLRDCGQVYAFVQNIHGEVLSDNIGLLVLTGKPVFVSNPFVLRYLTNHGWSDQPLQDKIASKSFTAIVLSSDPKDYPPNESEHWTHAVLKEINDDYVPIGHFQCTLAGTILVPSNMAGNAPVDSSR